MTGLDTASRDSTVERTVMLTDAVVAIAMTLLVLPLVEAVPEVDQDNVGGFVGDHLSLFISFIVSFLVILLFWAAHQRLFRMVTEMTAGLRLLNATWLLLIAFLPFPTALVGRGPTTSTTPIYIGTVLLLDVVSVCMTLATSKQVTDARARQYLRKRAIVAVAVSVVLLACTAIATVSPDAALFGLLAIAVIRLIGDRWSAPRQEQVPA
jgi:uncharacterized membrane protein